MQLLDLKYKITKSYWKLLKYSQNTDKFTGPVILLQHRNSVTISYLLMTQILPFIKLMKIFSNLIIGFLNPEAQILFSELDETISEQEIVRAIKKINSGKSGGPDRLLNDCFKLWNWNIVIVI